jgi:phosphate/sulfate permease
MALCALVGIGSMLAFVTVRWSGTTGRYVVALFVMAAIGFVTCASAAVFTAARDTYARSPRENSDREQ